MQTERDYPDVDLAVYENNRAKYPPEKLRPYMGQYVAFNGEGTEIIASASDYPTMFAKLEALGIPPRSVVLGWIDD